jgi:hypothetical protein
VAVLVNEVKAAGSYSVVFNGSALASGLYVARMEAGAQAITQKLMLVR